jgi:hypothetical protein
MGSIKYKKLEGFGIVLGCGVQNFEVTGIRENKIGFLFQKSLEILERKTRGPAFQNVDTDLGFLNQFLEREEFHNLWKRHSRKETEIEGAVFGWGIPTKPTRIPALKGDFP